MGPWAILALMVLLPKKLVFIKYMAEEDYEKLRDRLEKNSSWPSVYMFKFIVSAQNKQVALVEALFTDLAVITLKESSTGKYISITAREVMLSPEAVIEVYKKAALTEGLISL